MKHVSSWRRPILNSFGQLSLSLTINLPGCFFITFTTPTSIAFSTESIWASTYLRRNELFIEYTIQQVKFRRLTCDRMQHMVEANDS